LHTTRTEILCQPSLVSNKSFSKKPESANLPRRQRRAPVESVASWFVASLQYSLFFCSCSPVRVSRRSIPVSVSVSGSTRRKLSHLYCCRTIADRIHGATVTADRPQLAKKLPSYDRTIKHASSFSGNVYSE